MKSARRRKRKRMRVTRVMRPWNWYPICLVNFPLLWAFVFVDPFGIPMFHRTSNSLLGRHLPKRTGMNRSRKPRLKQFFALICCRLLMNSHMAAGRKRYSRYWSWGWSPGTHLQTRTARSSFLSLLLLLRSHLVLHPRLPKPNKDPRRPKYFSISLDIRL